MVATAKLIGMRIFQGRVARLPRPREDCQERQDERNRSDVESDLVSLGLKTAPVRVDRAKLQIADELRENQIEPVGRWKRVIEQLAR